MVQHECPKVAYLSSKVKDHLCFQKLKEVFKHSKTY